MTLPHSYFELFLISDPPNIGSDSSVSNPCSITDGEAKSSSEKIQGDHSPETHLYKSDIGKDGSSLSNFITRQGDNPPLENIDLYRLRMPLPKWEELFQFTSKCKYLRHLRLSFFHLDKAVNYLVQSIKSWGNNPPLDYLELKHCSIPEQGWTELLQSLSSCNKLSHLDLSKNTIGEAGQYLAESIKSWGNNPPL